MKLPYIVLSALIISNNTFCNKPEMPTFCDTLRMNYEPLKGHALLGMMHGAVNTQSPEILLKCIEHFPYSVPHSLLESAKRQFDSVNNEYPTREELLARSTCYSFGTVISALFALSSPKHTSASQVLIHSCVRSLGAAIGLGLAWRAYENYNKAANYEEGKQESIKKSQAIVALLEHHFPQEKMVRAEEPKESLSEFAKQINV